jgi:hypothetical protein
MRVAGLLLILLMGGLTADRGPREQRSREYPRQTSEGVVWMADGNLPPPPPVARLARA